MSKAPIPVLPVLHAHRRILDLSAHPGLSRLRVTLSDYPAEWAKKMSVIPDTEMHWTYLPVVIKGQGKGRRPS